MISPSLETGLQPSLLCSSTAQTLSALVGRALGFDIHDPPARATLVFLVDVSSAFDKFPSQRVSARVANLQDGTVLWEIVVLI